MLKLSNRFVRFILVFVILFLMQQVTYASEIRVLLYEAKEGGSYVPADVTELEKAESLFLRTLQGDDVQVLKEEWRAIDFDLIEIREKGKNYLVLQEVSARKLSYDEEKELKRLISQIQKFEKEKDEFYALMAEPSFYQNDAKIIDNDLLIRQNL